MADSGLSAWEPKPRKPDEPTRVTRILALDAVWISGRERPTLRTGIYERDRKLRMDRSQMDEIVRRRLLAACDVAEAYMTPEAKEQALEIASLPDFLMELSRWIPAGTQEPIQEQL